MCVLTTKSLQAKLAAPAVLLQVKGLQRLLQRGLYKQPLSASPRFTIMPDLTLLINVAPRLQQLQDHVSHKCLADYHISPHLRISLASTPIKCDIAAFLQHTGKVSFTSAFPFSSSAPDIDDCPPWGFLIP